MKQELALRDKRHLASDIAIQPPESAYGYEWWKPTNRRRDLVKAAALILAEIERLDRKDTPNGQ